MTAFRQYGLYVLAKPWVVYALLTLYKCLLDGVVMKICLVEFNLAYPNSGSLSSYTEVVESYHWGFHALGFAVERRVNHHNPEARNIIFGYQIPIQLGLIDTYPSDTIFFNLERLVGVDPSDPWSNTVASKFQIWDYSHSNADFWNMLSTIYPVFFAKTSYAPILEKIAHNIPLDIDVLFYGSLTQTRLESLNRIAVMRQNLTGMSICTLSYIYGKQRDDFIARSKVILNFSNGINFEIVRVSYLLANRKAVLCIADGDGVQVEEDLRHGALKFVKTRDVFEVCQDLVYDDEGREKYATAGYEIFKQRDIRDVIKSFFGP